MFIQTAYGPSHTNWRKGQTLQRGGYSEEKNRSKKEKKKKKRKKNKTISLKNIRKGVGGYVGNPIKHFNGDGNLDSSRNDFFLETGGPRRNPRGRKGGTYEKKRKNSAPVMRFPPIPMRQNSLRGPTLPFQKVAEKRTLSS